MVFICLWPLWFLVVVVGDVVQSNQWRTESAMNNRVAIKIHDDVERQTEDGNVEDVIIIETEIYQHLLCFQSSTRIVR